MAVWRWEISLLMLKIISIFFNTRKEISYLCRAMQYPLYYNGNYYYCFSALE